MENRLGRALFRQSWHCAVEFDLLDEQDVELLELEDCVEEQQPTQQSHRHGRPAASAVQQLPPLFLVLPPVVVGAVGVGVWLCLSSAYLVLIFFSAALIILLLFSALLVLVLPRLACWLWVRHVDDHFRHFVFALRQRELALFGLRHFSPSSPAPLRAQRRQCLRKLCHFVRTFNTASARLVANSGQRDTLLFNFVGDEMRTLCEADQTEKEAAEDTDLHINTLKSLWQYHFLVRSEFIRCGLLALRGDLRQRQLLAFCRHLALVLNTVRRTTTAPLCTSPLSTSSRSTTRTNANASGNRGDGANLANAVSCQASVCRAQLEWALERLQPLPDDGADSAWQPPADVVKCVEQVALSLRHALEECQRQKQSQQQFLAWDGASGSPADSSVVHLLTAADALAQCQTENGDSPTGNKLEEDDDYQIFELDTATATTAQQHTEQNENDNDGTKAAAKCRNAPPGEDVCFVDANAKAAGVALAHDAVLRELGAALTLRKEECLRRERRALARARGVPDEAVPAHELDRTPFAGATAASCHDAAPTARRPALACNDTSSSALTPLLSQLQQEAALMPSAEAVAAQRAAILGAGDGTALRRRNEMEQFGDDDEEGKKEGTEENE